MGFKPSCFDCDLWLKDRGDDTGFDYICTYVNDFIIMAKDLLKYMMSLQGIYNVWDIQEPADYLGVTYVGSPDDHWTINFKKNIKEGISSLEHITGMLWKYKTPIAYKDEPESDNSPFLNNEGHHLYQTCIGMAQCLVTIERIDIAFALTSYNR